MTTRRMVLRLVAYSRVAYCAQPAYAKWSGEVGDVCGSSGTDTDGANQAGTLKAMHSAAFRRTLHDPAQRPPSWRAHTSILNIGLPRIETMSGAVDRARRKSVDTHALT